MKINPDAFFVTFADSITQEKVKALIATISDIVAKHKPSQLYILFSSGGGNVNAGVTLYNFLRALPTKVVLHNIGSVDSIATAIFLAGNKRYANSNSNFVFHGFTWTFPVGVTPNRKQLQESISTIQQNESSFADIITSRTSINKEEVIALLDQGESTGHEIQVDRALAERL
jgi:ATP-dependent protease ClpP protease subunit